ncbi:MAG: DUF2088 domain-containing protein [Candidatus Fermentithermobacillus carboniphilus]|uniref:DUF2088 domain-containing protein n=1 Tax=Candidatus Fermentithermobacillus carboniphilus TaxID=3085328 RepID=A0AAT9LBP0_9FIRM|nr:MAG: DUF2088 domain-containing protein [Candidatus Fermentithermobacillus carboniphilus]
MVRRRCGYRSVDLKYGEGSVKAQIRGSSIIACISAGVVEKTPDEDAEILRALSCPIGTPPLTEIARGRRSAAIVVPDITRTLPREKMLRPVLSALNSAGIPDERIKVIFGLGTHRPHTEEERRSLVGSGRSLAVKKGGNE